MSKEVDGLNVKEKKTWSDRKQDLKDKFKHYGNELKNKWQNNKKKILINYLIFVSIFLIFLIFDQVTKSLLFKWQDYENFKGDRTVLYVNAIFGIRSVEHHGVTILPWKGKTTVYIIQALSVIIFLALLAVPFLTDSKTMIIMFALIASGNVGNMLDRFMFSGHVKDIIFASFLEKWQGRELGTFNIADVSLVCGSIGLILYFFIQLIAEYIDEQKEKNALATNQHSQQENVESKPETKNED
ncbi:signal peptidase II [Mycoplasma simbae]|uniref:signal peptidase II n=1 Tax=Mycoplasma simbae TaxID=36744 RepID=UPI000689F412|nr:signal peptidase II [Mycoplasma simbae]